MRLEDNSIPQTPETFDDPVDLLRAIRRRIGALSEHGMRAGVIGDMLFSHPPESCAFVLDQLVRGAVAGDERATAAMLAFTSVMLAPSDHDEDARRYEALRSTYETAAREGRDTVTYLFLDLPAHRVLENRKSLQGPRFDRDVSLGERKQMASSGNKLVIERLLLDLDPSVIRKLCVNPLVRQSDILRVCTRRPNIPEAIMEVARSPRWVVRGAIRYALLSNPYAPTGLGLKFLPLLRVQELRDVARSVDLHPAISQTAGRLLNLRGASRVLA